jgi:hypothetical protein
MPIVLTRAGWHTRATWPSRSFWRVSAVVAVALAARSSVARADDKDTVAAAGEASVGAGPAADSASPVAEIAALNRKALDDYDNLNFDDAKTALKNALALCDRNGLGSDPVRAQTYLNLGVVLLAADAQHRDVAVANLRRAIQIQADIKLPERLANPEVKQAFAEAQSSVRATQATRAPAPTTGGASDAKHPPARRATSGDEDEEVEASAEPPEGGEHSRWFIGFGIGSGIGWASGTGEVSTVQVPSGFQPSSVIHLAPELGYFLRPDLLLSLQGRIQFISGATPERDPGGSACGSDQICSPSHGATAVFAKATMFFAPSGFRPYLSGALGVGTIRHVVSLPGRNNCGTDPAHPVACVDTAAAGPVLLGPGGGFMYELGRHFALTLGASALVGVSAFTFHLDVGGGIAVEL